MSRETDLFPEGTPPVTATDLRPAEPGNLLSTAEHIELADAVMAHNYHPLPVVIAAAHGVWVTDVEGRRYLDALAGYSALNFGHGHPALVAAAQDQLTRVTLTSRAFHNDRLGPFCRDLAALAGMDLVLPMNTGAEAVETAIKVARKWGYDVKGVPDGQADIIVAAENFHGRTTTIVSFSTDQGARACCGDARGRHPQHGRRADRAGAGRGRRGGAPGGLPAGGARAVHRGEPAVPRR